MNRQVFFNTIRLSLFRGHLSPDQVRGIESKLDAFDASGITDHRWWAYMLATSYHETDRKMQPVEEYGRGKGKRYGRKIMYSGRPYELPDEIYYGRGDVQLTWYENYKRMGELLGIPLLEQPELALDPKISARIMIEGMTRGHSGRGDFTGVSLENYFNSTKDDPVNARKIINRLDRASLIAGYHRDFLQAIRMST